MATIERRERQSGVVYLADVRIRGFPRQKKTFKRLTDAKFWAQQTESAIRRGEFRDVHTTARKKTFQALIEQYRADVFSQKGQKTQDGEKYIIDRWEKALGKYVLSSINSELVNRKLLEIEAEGDTRQRNSDKNQDSDAPVQPKSRRTMKYYRDTLAMVFKHAAKWGWIGHDPMDNVKPITNLRNERIRYLDDDERKALLAACKASNNRQLYPLVVFALSTGGRKGEILGLTLDDLDLKRGVAIFRNTKNGDTRAAPLVGHLKDILQEQIRWVKKSYKNMEPKPSKRWLFPSNDGQAPIDLRYPWVKARDTAGLIDFRFHDLRHSTASYLAMSGASQLEIAEVLGHRTLQMVKRYSHLSESHVKGLITRLDESLF